MKRKRLLMFLFLCVNLIATSAVSSENKDLLQLFTLSAEGLNYSGLESEDQIIKIAQKAEQAMIQAKDYDNLFKIEQIVINSYCLKGDIGLALSKAQQMFEEAKQYESNIGLALAFQAIGDTYMHSNQNEQAYDVFADAESRLATIDDDWVKLRLAIQQMQVCVNLQKMNELERYLLIGDKIIERAAGLINKKHYAFHLLFYRTLYNIGTRNVEKARLSLEQVNQEQYSDQSFDYGRYYLSTCYYELAGDYAQALQYCDSTLTAVLIGGNITEYKNVLIEKAVLLEKNDLKSEACSLYRRANYLTDSLNKSRYSRQIDSLHIAYWVDQLALETTTAYNQLLTRILIYSILLLLVVVIFIFFIKKQNRHLLLSRNRLSDMRQSATDAYQTKSLFLSNMSHELRTPLNAIVGFSELLGTEAEIDDTTKEQCGNLIQQNSDLLLKLFNDVADFSALCENNIRFTYNQCDVVDLCRNVIDTVEKVKRSNAQMRFVSSLNHLELNTDSGRLQQVLINLLINATKFTSQGTITLRLEVDTTQEEAIFSVEDTGCGIPLDKQPHIFERFEKLHDGVQGAGLGLSICQLIINYVGGRIWIDSAYTEGARFVFTHPLHGKPEQKAEESISSQEEQEP